jgi:antitoxin component YwqK of YwqJK toxin-antitoxin module
MKTIQHTDLTWQKLKGFLMFNLIVFISSCSSTPDNGQEMSSEDLKEIEADCDCAQIDFKRDAFGNKIKGSLTYNINTEQVFSGTCEEKWGDNSRKQIRQYSNGELHGIIASWDEEGTLRQHLNYSNGKSDGLQRVWNADGILTKYTERVNGGFEGYSWEIDDETLELERLSLYIGENREEHEFSMKIQTGSDSYYTFTSEDEIDANDQKAKDKIFEFFKKAAELGNGKMMIGHFFVETNQKHKENEQFELEFASEIVSKFPDDFGLEKESKYSDFYGFNQNSVNNAVDTQDETVSSIETLIYKISDPDGYSNLRETPGGTILKKVYDNETFEVIGSDGDHKKVKLSDGTVGFIHQSRVVKVN